MNAKDFAIFFVFLLAGSSECSRILITYPTISQSHAIPLQALAKELAAKGHQITFVSPFPLSEKISNYRDIKITFNEADKGFLDIVSKDPKSFSFFTLITKMPNLIFGFGNTTLQHPEMRKLMNEEKFDLVIVGFFMTEFMLGLADHFKCPSIVFTPAGGFGLVNQMIGNPLSVATVPVKLISGSMDVFTNRLKNFLVSGIALTVSEYVQYRSRLVY